MSKVAPEVMKEAIETILRLNKEKGRKVRPAAAARPAGAAGGGTATVTTAAHGAEQALQVEAS